MDVHGIALRCRTSFPSARFLVPAALLWSTGVILTGCGTGDHPASTGPVSGPIPGESTIVAIELSSTANDQLIHFNMTLGQISLTNAAGVTTTISNTPMDVDFIPSNSNAAPFATVTVPQDVYTSATVSLMSPRFSYVFVDSQGEINTVTDAYGGTYAPVPPVVTLAGPLTVSGSALGLRLDLQVSSSATYADGVSGSSPYSISPTFSLSSFAIPTDSATPKQGECFGLAGQITAINSSANSMTLTLAGHPYVTGQSLTVALSSTTTFQGVTSASGLAVGNLINMDIALQANATYAATRVELQDGSATNMVTGQLMEVDPSFNHFVLSTAVEQQGTDLTPQPVGIGYEDQLADSTKFQTSARFPNLGSLPFTPVFSSATLAAGQMVSIGSQSISYTGGTYTVPTSATLVPQIVDGTVLEKSTQGDYTVYGVSLGANDLIVQMNSPAGASVNTLLPNANHVTVYVDSTSSTLDTTSVAIGSTYRFDGLLLNDGGVLRLVCDRIDTGVPQ